MKQEKIIISILKVFKEYKTQIDETTSKAERELRKAIVGFCDKDCPEDEICEECKIMELSK